MKSHVHDTTSRIYSAVLASFALLVLLPFLLVLGLLVRLDSPGPSLFVQVRLGRNGVPFRIYKMRTMADGLMRGKSHVDEAIVASNRDARITRIGRVLRGTSLDELPQLWNILKGEMVLVGPRPLLPEQLGAIPPAYRSRFEVRPGLTGLAQIRGRRGLDWPKQLQADVEYVRRRSVIVDVNIILRTVGQVLGRKGVYSRGARNWREFLDKSFE